MSELSGRLAALTPEQRAQLSARLLAASPQPGLVPLAVIGVGCRFPGGANSPEAFWQRLCEGFDAVSTTPSDRWDASRYFSRDAGAPGKTTSRWGGFLDQVDQFDRKFFGLSPREAVHMDPQQRLLLETAWEALEDAGQMTEQLNGCAAGVFIGAQSHSSDYYLLQARNREQLDTYTATGTAHSVLANRLSFLLDLRGPSLAVDTACSSSLVAVHLACQSLRMTECDLAIAGGVNLILTPDFQICLAKLEMMAPDGRCKTFDHRANGFVRGEGCGVVVLKRLSDAVRDRDPVLAVILGSAVNQDGASNGLTAPNGPAQQAVVRRALEAARVPPQKVGYVETHGTGTALGDPIEVEALMSVLAPGTMERGRCVLGAVKTNLGHLEAASGIAGLIKAVLCLKHGLIPANLHFERINPHLSLEGTPFDLPAENLPWPRSVEPRIAGVSSFGFGGTNAHVVLSDGLLTDAAAGEDGERTGNIRPLLLPVSARSGPALRKLAASYREFLSTGEGAKLPPADIAYTASLRRRHHQHRCSVVGTSAAEWSAALGRQLDAQSRRESINSPALNDASSTIAFVYSGQGSQWPTMGCQLIRTEPVFRDALERCDTLFRDHAPWSILAELSSPAGTSQLHHTEVAQPVLFALQVALTELWRSWGIQPAAVVGHSVGEAAAAHAAGVLSLPDAVRVVFHRGRLMQRATGRGRMAAIGMSPGEAARLIESHRNRVTIAAINSPSSVVLSGDAQLLDDLVRELSGRGIFARLLAVDCAFHSPQMDAYGPELSRSLEGLQVMTPATRIVSTVSGRWAQAHDFTPVYWARNIRQPVLFAAATQALLAGGQRLFVELGPHPVLCPAIAQCEPLDGCPLMTFPSLSRDKDEHLSLLDALARLYSAGCTVNWRSLFPANRACVELPRYPWERKRYWLNAPTEEKLAAVILAEPGTQPEPPADWFYQLEWQPRTNLTREISRTSVLEPVDLERIATSLESRCRRLDREFNGDMPAGSREFLDQLTTRHICTALAALGTHLSVGNRWSKAGLDRELNLLPRYQRLLGRLLDILAGAGILRDDGQHWTVVRPAPADVASWRSDPHAGHLAGAHEILELVERCGSRLSDVLRGRCDPLALLFAEDEKTSAEAIYRDAAPSRLGNRMAAESLRELVAQLPPDRTLRILEIGAGTGGATAALLPLLPSNRCEYIFTDLSPLFLKRAAANFARFPFVSYELFDLEQPPAGQGFASRQFDLIVAANVLHATRDLASSLDHIRSLLAPGGILLMIECTASRPWLDITFGITEGWWRFTDNALRDTHPLLAEAAWVDLLGKRGFSGAIALPLQQPDAALFDQALIFARNVSAHHRDEAPLAVRPSRLIAGKYLVVAGSRGLAGELQRQLEMRGDICYLVSPCSPFARLGKREFSASLKCPDDFRQVLENVGPGCQAVVYVAESDPADLVATCQHPLSLVQALLATGFLPPGGLWLVTSGCQPVTASDSPALEQSPLWGLGRGIALEAPGLNVRLVDLDPAARVDRSAAAVLDEIDDPDLEDQIALRHQQRYVARLKRLPGLKATGSPWRISGTHLVTGGLGAVGSQLALYLASAGAGHLLLVVKHPLPDRRNWETLPADGPDFARVEIVRQLEALGSKVTVAAVDLTDEAALAKWFSSLDFSSLALRGVWHTAMNLSSGPVRELEPHAVSSMIKVKSTAAWHLHQLSRAHQLDYFVLFSSTTALWGAEGLAHYAAANAFLDALANYRRAEQLPATVVNWGAWLQTPSTIERSRAVRAGLRPMTASAALAALQQTLTAGICQAAVADVDWRVFQPAYESRRCRPLLEHFSAEAITNSPAEQDPGEQLLGVRLSAAAPDERRELLARHINRLLVDVLGTGADGFSLLDRGKGFFDLGMDSLTSVQLRRRLESAVGRPLPVTLTFNYPTIDSLADYLLDELFPPTAGTSLVAHAGMVTAAPAQSPHDAATEEELFDQLAARLATHVR